MATAYIDQMTRAMLSPDRLRAHVRGGKRWNRYRHLAFMGQLIARSIVAGDARVILNLGPGTGKSQLCAVGTPAWILANWPTKKIIIGTHTKDLSTKFGHEVRELLKENPELGVSLRQDSTRKDEWYTRQGGGVKAVGVGGATIGFRADAFILSDLYPGWKEAASRSYRRNMEDWFEATADSRLDAGGSIIAEQHRMHADDLTGYLCEHGRAEAWARVRLPAICDDAADPLGRAIGDVLCPAMQTRERAEAIRSVKPAAIWAAMYQQRPTELTIGAAYHRFSVANIDAAASLDITLPLALCIDFNRTPSMHLLIAQHDPKQDRFVFRHELTESRNLHAAMGEFAAWWGKQPWRIKPEVHVYGDASGSTHSTQTGQADYQVVAGLLAKAGARFRIRVPASNPPIVDRVMTFNDALQDVGNERHVFIHPDCKALIRDMREQATGEDGKPDESDGDLGHAAAAAGYFVHYSRPVGGRIIRPRGRFGFADVPA